MGSKPKGISASRGAAILGLSNWSTPVKIWLNIMEDREPGFCVAHGFEPPEFEENAAMRWGLAFEDAIIEQAEQISGQKIGAREALFEVPGDVPITCHVDGIYGVESGPARADTPLHEGKTTNAFTYREKWGEPGTDRIPREYQVQVQHQMACTGAQSAIVSVLVFPSRVEDFEAAGSFVDGDSGVIDPGQWMPILAEMGCFHQYLVEANQALQEMMLDEYRRFWADHVLAATPPELQTFDDIRRLVVEPRGTVVATDEQLRWASEFAQINGEINHARKQQDKLKALLIGAVDMGAEHPLDDDSTEAIVLRAQDGRKIASYAKQTDKNGKTRKVFRCNG